MEEADKVIKRYTDQKIAAKWVTSSSRSQSDSTRSSGPGRVDRGIRHFSDWERAIALTFRIISFNIQENGRYTYDMSKF